MTKQQQELNCVEYIPNFITKEKADSFFEKLLREVKWEQKTAVIYGKEYKIPRLQQWYGDKSYTYSGMTLQPLPMIEPISELHQLCENACQTEFNSVLVNLYRDGNDTVGFHADNEKELGDKPVIASLSFGAERDFIIKDNKTKDRYSFSLSHGSLIVMFGNCQDDYLHSLPRREKVKTPRINLTFRKII